MSKALFLARKQVREQAEGSQAGVGIEFMTSGTPDYTLNVGEPPGGMPAGMGGYTPTIEVSGRDVPLNFGYASLVRVQSMAGRGDNIMTGLARVGAHEAAHFLGILQDVEFGGGIMNKTMNPFMPQGFNKSQARDLQDRCGKLRAGG